MALALTFGAGVACATDVAQGLRFVSGQVQPGKQQSVEELWRLLAMPEMVSILHDEGVSMALDADVDLLGHEGGQRWNAAVQAIYDESTLSEEVHAAFEQHFTALDLPVLCSFYKDDEIQLIIAKEVAARRAFMDLEFEQVARERWLRGENSDQLDDMIRDHVEQNDLIELNVMGALNSNYAFLSALSQSLPDEVGHMTEHEILAQVWTQEVDIRGDTTEWMYAFLHTAYEDVDPVSLERYVTFSASPSGRALNTALFAAFDSVYLRLSSDLGRLAGKMGQEEEL
ncbi:hypothetical protein [Aliiroseovarius halocynthiae]|uniref:hypothetical protein n=1 Tax=Aliiroseovarius halocynthiae TaxID=985055 RepID=UPI00115F583D|nr:hypothetical protein [Aliiroseovarius halocynthiae]